MRGKLVSIGLAGMIATVTSTVWGQSLDVMDMSALFTDDGSFISTCPSLTENPLLPAAELCLQPWDEYPFTALYGLLPVGAEFESAYGGVIFRNSGFGLDLILRPPNVGANTLHSADLEGLFLGDFTQPPEGHFKPVPGHPVEVCANIAWSGNYSGDGSGGALGTTGIGLWSAGDLSVVDVLGLTWASAGGAPRTTGLTATVAANGMPVTILPVRSTNMQALTGFRMVWREQHFGPVHVSQTVEFWLNGEYVGTSHLHAPIAGLSPVAWVDNLTRSPTAFGFAEVTSEQVMSIADYLVRECADESCNCWTGA